MAGSRRARKAQKQSLTAADFVADGRRVTRNDLHAKLRELGAYAPEAEDTVEAVAEIAAEEAVIETAEHQARRDLGPLGDVLQIVPRAQLIAAIAVTTVIIVFKVGELLARPRGAQIEVRKLVFPPES